MERRRGFATRAQQPRVPEVRQEPASVPLYQTATWGFDTTQEFADVMSFRRGGYTYTRGYGNPTIDAFCSLMAELEGTQAAVAFASGTAAIHATLTTLAGAGGRIVSSSEVYGGTYALMTKVLPRYGIDVVFVDPHDLGALEEAVPGAALLYVETIANPLVTVADLREVAARCTRAGVPCVVDNTFASPYLCEPASLGCSYVVHSATKYIGGHADLIGGVVCCSADAVESLRETAIETGGTMQPLEAWLCLRGLSTLALRMEQHSRTAASIATFLEAHPKVSRVHYPGLESHPQHDVARRELRRFGGMLAIEIDGGFGGGTEAGARVSDALELAWIGGSLGGPRTLVAQPASTTHRQLDAAARRSAGIADGLLRVSAGLEDADDLIDDLSRALEKA
jgi:methionine-gamma-lyase